MADDRQYLVRVADLASFRLQHAPRRSRSTSTRWTFVVLSATVVFLATLVRTGIPILRRSHFCLNCAASRETKTFALMTVELVPLGSTLRPGELTRIVERGYPEPCPHRWSFRGGSGGGYL